ncbi:T9SS type A sorting domain-containing protein [Pseudocnuella soli]|uniref:T9SS type A sorting domain-containing protein n=1 Tax=Pseudocnuella soli TaxID=2502779 RepID=UPI0010508C4C|nr:T9SS type A sorting domain-containing protein [Pseudocnuella soli]
MKKTTIQLLLCGLLFLPASLLAQDTATFGNYTPIDIPFGDDAPVLGNPYPSKIVVTGMAGTISKITVRLFGLDHNSPDAVDIMLVPPDGANTGIILLSDVGGAYDLPNPGTGVNIVLDDDATEYIPDNSPYPSGTYKITNRGGTDSWPGQPKASPFTTLAGFNGYGANGEWRLYVVNDIDGCEGYIHGGWDMTIYTEPSVLPVKYSAFSAAYQAAQQAVQLKWTTENETNSKAFVVERSADGFRWTTVVSINAAGNSSRRRKYQYDDVRPAGGVHFYRIKMLDKNGRFEYTKVVSLQVPQTVAAAAKAYFNSSNASVVLSPGGMLGKKALVQLIDLGGRVVASRSQSLLQPAQTVLELPHLKDGLYVLEVICGSEKFVQKVMIRR